LTFKVLEILHLRSAYTRSYTCDNTFSVITQDSWVWR